MTGHTVAQALYELPDEEVTPENVSRLADETEVKIQGALAGRPLLAVPHVSTAGTTYPHMWSLSFATALTRLCSRLHVDFFHPVEVMQTKKFDCSHVLFSLCFRFWRMNPPPTITV